MMAKKCFLVKKLLILNTMLMANAGYAHLMEAYSQKYLEVVLLIQLGQTMA